MNGGISRRRFHTVTAALAGTLLAGCSSGPGPKFRLKAYEIGDIVQGSSDRKYLIDPNEIESYYSVELSSEYKQTKIDELVETGTVSTRGWELSYRIPWGPTWRDKRTCFEYDETYYRIGVESRREVERTRWVFYFDWDDQDPSDDSAVITLPDNSLSSQDQRIVETAHDVIPTPQRPQSDRNLANFSVVYHEELDDESSELVPEPTFDYLSHGGEFFRARSEKGPINRPEQRFTVEPVAESPNAYREYAKKNYPDARFSDVNISEDAAEILDETVRATDGYSYEEDPPLSEGLKEVLEHLTISDHLEPHDSYEDPTWFSYALAEYEGKWYELSLVIYP